jgi:hypothetical protein
MKAFMFLLVVLGLILGLRLVRECASCAREPSATIHEPAVVVVPPATAERDSDGDRDRDREDGREEVEGLPVPIVSGTRVTEATLLPPKPKGNGKGSPAESQSHTVIEAKIHQAAATLPPGVQLISGRLSATEDRARADARLQLDHEVTEWLTPEVPTSWTPPGYLINGLIRRTDVYPIVKDYATVYEATLQADLSPGSRSAILAAYQHELVVRRLAILGGILGFVLACLASLAGYIRADEATRGYYTHWLRALAAASVGASGVLIYQILT